MVARGCGFGRPADFIPRIVMPEEKKIKIIYVTAALEVGGAEMFLLDLVKHLDKDKFAPAVATVVGGGKLESLFRATGVPLYIYGSKPRCCYVGGFLTFFQLWALFRRERPQIVHTQLFGPDFWGRLAAWLAGVPIILTTEQNINVDQSKLREWLKKLTYKLADGVAAISTAVKNYTIKEYNVLESKIVIIPNDVDVAEMEKRLKIKDLRLDKSASDKKILLTVGRLVEQKGQKYLLEAFGLLKNRENLELWLAGDGILRAELEVQAKKLGIASQVKFLGTRSDIPQLLAQADIFVFPSLWEGLGIAVLEAAIAKKPIVASSVDGILDIIKSGKSGLLVPPGDSQALSASIEFMLNHPEQAKLMVEEAYEQVKNNFDIKAVVKKYQNFYENFTGK